MRRFTIDVKGPLHGIEFGGEGPLVLLVHGLSGSAVNWVEVADGLAVYGRVVAPELPGFGRTPPAGRPSSLEGQAELLAEYIRRESDEPAFVIGNSMGAMAAMMLAGRYPELVDRLVLINSPAPSPSVIGMAPVWVLVMVLYLIPGLNKALLTWLHSQGTPEQRTEAGIDLMVARADRISKSTRRLHSQVTTERGTMPWTHDVHLEAYRSVIRNLIPYSRFDQMVRRVSVPALMMHGTRDLVVPITAAERLASVRPDWTYRPLVEVGHIPMMESPELCLRLIGEFVEATTPTPGQVAGSLAAIGRGGGAGSNRESVRAATY